MNGDKNGQTPNDEPPPATPDILIKGFPDDEGQEPSSVTQDIMHFTEDPPEAKQDILMKMLTQSELEKRAGEDKKEAEGEEEE